MVTHDEVHLEAQERYWREHPEDRPQKSYGYLHRVSDAVRDIEAGIREIALQRRNGSNFTRSFRFQLVDAEYALREVVGNLRRALEDEAQQETSCQEVVSS